MPALPGASEQAQRIADAALDAYTKEDWHYVLNALRSDRAATYISSRPPEERPEVLLLIEARRCGIVGSLYKGKNMRGFPDHLFGVRVQIYRIQASSQYRDNAVCVCYSTECPGVYGGECHKDDDDANRCPCGCWLMVNLNNQISYAYDMEGDNCATGGDGCLASELPPAKYNQTLFEGQAALRETGTGSYAFEITKTEYEGDDEDWDEYEMEEAEATGVLFFNGNPLEGSVIRSINSVGTIISLLHGEMMEHAARG